MQNPKNQIALPSRINGVTDRYSPVDFEKTKALYEAIGIQVIGPTQGTDLFFDVVLPEGWAYKREGGYWSYVLDQDGKERVSIFYKSAPWDTDAFANIKKA